MTNSKLVTDFVVRITPTGWPLQMIIPLVQFQVSGAQLTFMKSALVKSRQPGPVPSINAFGNDDSVSAATTIIGCMTQNPIALNKQTRESMAIAWSYCWSVLT